MQLNTLTNQTIALAGIAQAAALAEQLAVNGTAEQAALNASVGSILKIDAPDVLSIFGGLEGLRLGLTILGQQLNGSKIAHPAQARYAASLVFLEKQLRTHTGIQKTISQGIEKAQLQSEQFGLLHDNVFACLGDVYYSTISTLTPRIMVNGEESYLRRADIVNKIRTILLAGIRAARLWRQCGGTRWKFLLLRKKLQAELAHLLSQLPA